MWTPNGNPQTDFEKNPQGASWDSNQLNVGGLVMIIMKKKSDIVIYKYYI
jgi:hypothetical protein